MVKIATFNVNSVRARLPNLLAWLDEAQPDVVLLQELKCMDEAFPAMEIEERGYNIALKGQKTYNGVAILSKFPFDEVIKELPGDETDVESRYIEATLMAGKQVLRVASIYLPNGGEPSGPRFPYKLKFLERLTAHAQTLLGYDEVLVLGGDYNVAPFPIDVFDPKSLYGTTCFHPEEHARFRPLLNLGLTDAYRTLHPDVHQFSWWDYRGGGYEHNKGMRIDHLLLSPQAAPLLKEAGVDEKTRGEAKASDHAPVWATLAL